MDSNDDDSLGIDDLLAEPIIRMMMAADRLEEAAVRASLLLAARHFRERREDEASSARDGYLEVVSVITTDSLKDD